MIGVNPVRSGLQALLQLPLPMGAKRADAVSQASPMWVNKTVGA